MPENPSPERTPTMLLKPGILRPFPDFTCRKPEHPGIFLQRCYLTPLAISQSDLARLLGISRRRVNEIVNGQRAISADTALKLAQLFRTSPMFWLEKQQLWELYRALHP
jgi:antitoxin HigA-1